jgi:8-oxo-dGTP pyrophosphatase MutT (NUDIX family)
MSRTACGCSSPTLLTACGYTPGGALERDETAKQAALRELYEETGVDTAELSPCVWTRVHRFEWGRQRYAQRERFFVARVEAPDICIDG